MNVSCPAGHQLELITSSPGDRGCDGCGIAICTDHVYHCSACDYDLCANCKQQSCDQQEADRLASEYADLEINAEEQAARDEVTLHDAQLTRLRLEALLQRYADEEPNAEQLAERYEAEIDELSAEVQRLREERTKLLTQDCGHPDGANRDDAETPRCSSTSPRAVKSAPLQAKLHKELKHLWRCQAESAARQRRAHVDEWFLDRMKADLQKLAQTSRGRESSLTGWRQRCHEARALQRDIAAECVQLDTTVENELLVLVELNREVAALREACYIPAHMRQQRRSIIKFLDQEGGRLNTEQRKRGLQVVAKLYHEVAANAPALQQLASRAKTAMEHEFERFQWLEYRHMHAMQADRKSVV